MTKDFAHKAEGVCGYKKAKCWCSSVYWVDCFFVQETSQPCPFCLCFSFLWGWRCSAHLATCSGVWFIWSCHHSHFQNFSVKMMSFFFLSVIQQLVYKKLFILPKLLLFSYAKSPQKLISGALQLKSSMSWCFSDCNYLENFHFTSKLFTYLLETYVKRS